MSAAACMGSCLSCNGGGEVIQGWETQMEQRLPATTWTWHPTAGPDCPCLASRVHSQDPAAVWLLGDPLQTLCCCHSLGSCLATLGHHCQLLNNAAFLPAQQ